jgi:hypothetical protein
VCRRRLPLSSAIQRARTIDSSDGIVAPASALAMNQTHTGARSVTVATRAADEIANNTASGSSTRRWPNRSASRPACGEKNAVAQRAGRRDGAGDTVTAGESRDEHDRREADHGHRHPPDNPGRGEPPCTRYGEDLPVWRHHPAHAATARPARMVGAGHGAESTSNEFNSLACAGTGVPPPEIRDRAYRGASRSSR